MDTDKMRLSGILLIDASVDPRFYLNTGEWHETAVRRGNVIYWYSIL